MRYYIECFYYKLFCEPWITQEACVPLRTSLLPTFKRTQMPDLLFISVVLELTFIRSSSASPGSLFLVSSLNRSSLVFLVVFLDARWQHCTTCSLLFRSMSVCGPMGVRHDMVTARPHPRRIHGDGCHRCDRCAGGHLCHFSARPRSGAAPSLLPTY